MAHHDTRQPTCANCHYAFVPGEPDGFCPRCGQQNHAPDLKFGHVVEEFLEGVFHFDGKVFRTAGLLLFKPGELTKRFLAGHRAPYVPPIRLYVFISFVFFLVLSLQGSHKPNHSVARPPGLHRLATLLDSLDDANPLPADTVVKHGLHIQLGGPMSGKKAEVHTGLDNNRVFQQLPVTATAAQIDAAIRTQGEQPGYWNRLIVRRYLRWRDASAEEVHHDVLRGTSILVFLLMPLAALLLRLVYVRHQHHYISHLIFAIHLHCFLFVALLLNLGLEELPYNSLLTGLLGLAGAGYFVLALRRVYAQGWAKTLSKALLLGLNYGLLAVGAVLVVGAVGLVLF